MRFLITLFLLAPSLSFAQGMAFETGNWKAVLAKAKAQNRMVYGDVYTTWCGPCKVLEKTVFPQKEAGDKYNPLFVNYRIDAEKGEGIALKKKYAVSGFPTHLFINPKTEQVVYRTVGAAGGVASFNKHADVALEEAADPMTWAVYTKSFAAGTRDPQFLKAYLHKAERLEMPNDDLLDAYVATLDKDNIPDSALYFLQDNTHTIWSHAVPVLYVQRARLATRDTTDYYSYSNQAERWLYPSYNQIKDAKDENRLTQLETFIHTYLPEDADETVFFYRKQYYEETKNTVKLKQVEMAEATWITSRTLVDYQTVDDKTRKNLEASIRYQLTTMTIPEGRNIDTIVADNIARNAKSLPSVRAAQTLNDLAWKTCENKKATPEELQQAMKWSAKAMEFSAPYREPWAANADTHASLLYRTGQKDAAILLEEEALKALQGAESKEDAARYEQTLQKMRSGTY